MKRRGQSVPDICKPSRGLNGPRVVTVDKYNNIFVVEGNRRINKFSYNGELVAAVDSPGWMPVWYLLEYMCLTRL